MSNNKNTTTINLFQVICWGICSVTWPLLAVIRYTEGASMLSVWTFAICGAVHLFAFVSGGYKYLQQKKAFSTNK